MRGPSGSDELLGDSAVSLSSVELYSVLKLMFWFKGSQLNCLMLSHGFYNPHFQLQEAAVFSEKRPDNIALRTTAF